MASVRIRCPRCGDQLILDKEQLGASVVCPQCKGTFGLRPRRREENAEPDRRPDRAVNTREPAPSTPPRDPAGPQQPVRFKVTIGDGAGPDVAGKFDATGTGDGVSLRRKSQEIALPRGTPAKYLGGNRIAVKLGRDVVELSVTKKVGVRQSVCTRSRRLPEQ
jgi:DNA-directed RNA polymerase subunit RPC12/RpoP